MGHGARGDVARLFFALWPDDAARERLRILGAGLATRCQGRATPPANIHLTVHFLGDVDEARIAALEHAAASVRAPGFDLRLDQEGSATPAALGRLHAELGGELARAGFELEPRAYSPHVTLVRRIARPLPMASIDPIAWPARELALVRTEMGKGRYTTLARWPLA
jgi:2'-5' RNA ligase